MIEHVTTRTGRHATALATRARRLAVVLGVGLLVLLGHAGAALAQTAEDFTRLGNEAYNGKKYSEAVAAYTKAIQAEPRTALRAYRNMARAYNMLEHYTASKQYYDWYLELAPDADDARKVEYELRRVARKATAGATILSESQRAALERLEAALAAGPFHSADGGALAIYEVLLRTAYAAPNLALIQQRLASGLVEEAAAVAQPAAGQPGPALDRAGWQEVQKRLDVAKSFVGVTLPSTVDVAALEGTVRGWEAYLRGEYEAAATSFADAVKRQPGLLAAQWGHLLSLVYTANGDVAAATTRLEEARAAYRAAGRETEPHFSMLNAVLLRSSGKHREAAAVIQGL